MVLGDLIIKTKAFGAFSDKADSGAFQKRGQFPPEQRQRALFPIGPRKFQSFHIISFSLQDAQCSFRAPIGYAAA